MPAGSVVQGAQEPEAPVRAPTARVRAVPATMLRERPVWAVAVPICLTMKAVAAAVWSVSPIRARWADPLGFVWRWLLRDGGAADANAKRMHCIGSVMCC